MSESNKPINEFPKEKLERFRAFHDQAKRASEPERIEMKEDYSFVEGYGQWQEKEKNKLIRQDRPALVMNNVLPIINLISGQERASRLGISFKPRGLDDDRRSMIVNAAYHYMADTCDLIYEASDAFTDMAICGRGYLFCSLQSEDTDDPLGEIFFKRKHPLSVMVDPASSRYDLRDARYILDLKWINEDDLRFAYPGAMEDIRPGEWITMPAHLLGEKTIDVDWRNTRTGQIRLMTVWYKVPKRAAFVITQSGEVQRFNSVSSAKDAIDQIAHLASRQFQPVPDFDIVERVIKEVRKADITYWKILSDGPSPFKTNMYPIVPYTAYKFDELLMGVVRSLKDPQREKNKRWSQMLHIVNTMAKGGWKIPKGSISPDQLTKWPNEAGKPGFYFEYNSNIGEPKEIAGQNLPSSFISLMQISEDEMRKTSGAIQELLGIARASDQSGKALSILQNSGATILAPLFDSLVRSHKILGKLSISTIKQFYTPEKILNLLGQTDIDQVSQIETDVLDFIDKSINAEHDIVVDVTPLIASERQRQYAQATELLKAGLPVTPGLMELLISVSDFPNKEKYIAELRQMQQGQPQAQAVGGNPAA